MGTIYAIIFFCCYVLARGLFSYIAFESNWSDARHTGWLCGLMEIVAIATLFATFGMATGWE